jgi:hypothetical protein
MRVRSWGALALVVMAGGARGDDGGPGWRDRVSLTASERVRGEFVSWFEPPPGTAAPGAERYAFFASQLRVGARVLLPHAELALELQDTRLTGLPDDASLPPPQGSLGPGALYFLHTHDTTQGEPFLKQGFLTLRRGGLAATVGRFEYRDGLETVPADPTLAAVKRTRVAERLVGPFDFTHVTRSLDGLRVAFDRPAWNATALAVHPTHGGFEVSANREIGDVSLAGLALTLKRLPAAPPADVRVFYLYYQDDRDAPLKVDNRPLAARARDHGSITIHTVGAHALTAIDAGPGTVDLLAWGAGQAGDWGVLRHAAWAFALEGGYQLPRLPAAPWLRAGYDRSSGDADPADRTHGTFFQVLPTARTYAQLPFFNLMNVADAFAELLLRPHERVTLRSDYHYLTLGEGRDLWYAGGGADDDDLFGYAGAPARGRRDLAHLVDLSATVAVHPRAAVQAYYGHAFGGGVVRQTFAGTEADYGFLELTLRY